ncbi:YodL domain-containing protein [Neobacillus vireti]|uniref:YodL domain-containing protein n=1 Tax=Neobacillus vireti TaxID=220686 RepID=UPI003000E1FE
MIRMLTKKASILYDVTIFQTPKYREHRGYKEVHRTTIPAGSRKQCLDEAFRRFNVTDRMPNNYKGRFMATGDIILIDEGRGGQFYFQLKSGGWVPVNRINIR